MEEMKRKFTFFIFLLVLFLLLSNVSQLSGDTNKPVLSKKDEHHHLVVVRFQENLSWIPDYFPDIQTTVVQKVVDPKSDQFIEGTISSDSFSWVSLRSSLDGESVVHSRKGLYSISNAHNLHYEYVSNTNKLGRECSGYIYYILKNYHKLPTWIEFVHGAPERSASLARRYLLEPRGHFQSFAGNIVNRCFKKHQGEEGKDTGDETFDLDFEDVLRELNIKPPHCIRNFCCANFVVHKSRVLAIPKSKWEMLLKFSISPRPGPAWRNNCYHLEHFWHMILGEGSHTYNKFEPLGNSSYILADKPEEAERWDKQYRPWLK